MESTEDRSLLLNQIYICSDFIPFTFWLTTLCSLIQTNNFQQNHIFIRRKHSGTTCRLYLKAGCRWDENCTIGVENLLLRWFYGRSQTYFGQKPEEHCFSIKNRCLEVQKTIFEKNGLRKKIGDPKLTF